MMICTLTMTNFGPFVGTHGPIDLVDKGLVSITGTNLDDARCGSNGSGKSHILDAIYWCLFGIPPRGGKTTDVLNETLMKDLEVKIALRAKGQAGVVTRRLKCGGEPDGLSVVGFDGFSVALDQKETQRRFETEILGMDSEVFLTAVLFAQNENLKFAEQTDAARKKLLTKMIPTLAIVDQWLERAKEIRKATEETHRKAVSEEQNRTHRHNALLDVDPTLLGEDWDIAYGRNVAVFRAEHDRLETELIAAKGNASTYTHPEPLEPFQHHVDSAVLIEQGVTSAAVVKSLHDEIDREQRNQAGFSSWDHRAKTATSCPTCRQALPADQLLEPTDPTLWAASRDSVAKHQAAIVQHTALIDSARQQITMERAAHKGRTDQRRELERWHSEATNAAFAATQAFTTAQERFNAHQFPPQTNPHTPQIEKWREDLAVSDVQVVAAKRVTLEIGQRLGRIDWWIKALGPKGIKSHLLDASVNALTEEVNRWVGLLTGNVCWVEFDTTTTVGKGSKERQADKFTIKISRHNPNGTVTTRPFHKWSGGEKHRLAVAIDFGWSRVIASSSDVDCPQLFLDEVFQKSLDAEGKEAMGELLQALAPTKSTILVIDHDARMQGIFAKNIHVTKKGAESTLKEHQL